MNRFSLADLIISLVSFRENISLRKFHCEIIKWGASSWWSPSLCCRMRNSDGMTTGNTHSNLWLNCKTFLKNGFLKTTSCKSLSSFRVTILERQIPPGLYQLPSVHHVVDIERPLDSNFRFCPGFPDRETYGPVPRDVPYFFSSFNSPGYVGLSKTVDTIKTVSQWVKPETVPFARTNRSVKGVTPG